LESLLYCNGCGHGALAHEGDGCKYARCTCTKNLIDLVDEALELARSEIGREWQITR
jgi:hypothetical protein